MGDSLDETLPAEMMGVVRTYVQAGLQHARAAPGTVPSILNADNTLTALAQRYTWMRCCVETDTPLVIYDPGRR